MLADYHIHTIYSDDSEYPMEQMVRDAISLGLEEICVTDHVDYGVKRDWDDPRGMLYRHGDVGEPDFLPAHNVDYPRYVEEVAALGKTYGDRIAIKLGMEFGAQQGTLPEYQALFDRYPFDFIILSVHQVDDQTFWDQGYQRGKTQAAYNLGYYEEILALVEQFSDYSVLGHLDMITRYDRAGIYPFEQVKPVVTEILKRVIRDGKGIELNTSCHRYGLPDLTPSREILTLYRELGGRILTIGSDTHKPAHLGAHILETQRELGKLGFREICTYDRMEPVFHPLVK